MNNATAHATPLNAPTKRCSRCKTTKAVADFCGDKSRQDGLQPICRPCAKTVREERKVSHPGEQRKAYTKWYAKPENVAKASAANVNRARDRAHRLIAEFKSNPCMDCHQSFISAAMEFDHRPGTEKKFNLNYRVLGRFALEAVMDEITKCDVVCANCHRIRTVNRNQVGRKTG